MRVQCGTYCLSEAIHVMQTDNERGSIALVPDLQHFAAVQKLLTENKCERSENKMSFL
jgi:hypothetical protein